MDVKERKRWWYTPANTCANTFPISGLLPESVQSAAAVWLLV